VRSATRPYGTPVDVDRFIVSHEAEWKALTDLARRTGRAGRALGPGEVDELVRLYQVVSLHLSVARTEYRDPDLVRRLSAAVAAGHAAIHGARVPRLAVVRRFFAWTFPAAAWACRRQIGAAAAVFFGTAIVVGLVFWQAPDRIDLVMPQSLQDAYVDKDFVEYYSENPSVVFFSDVTTNNIMVGVLAYGLGALAVVPGAMILFENGAYLGLIAGLFAQRGQFFDTFLVYVLPHGLLELTAIVVAGGAGIRVGWALFAPGDRTRTQALAAEGQRSVVVVTGVAVAFLGAGLVEGFVTGAPAVPAGVKLAVGAAVWIGFLLWAFGRGRTAAAAGWTGSLEELRPSYRPIDPLVNAPPATGPQGFATDPLAIAADAARRGEGAA